MKLNQYLPEAPKLLEHEIRLGELTNSLSVMKGGGDSYKAPSIGLDQVVNSWLRQQMAYRQQMVLDFMSIAATVQEVRAPIHHLTSEVFRRGVKWKPKFAAKCNQCGTEFQDGLKACQNCQSTDLRKPDEKQKEKLESFLNDCNIYDQSLEEVLRQFYTDINILDDGFIYIAKEYVEGPDKSVRSRPTEIRRLHPALIEFDLDRKGLPKNSHFVCYIHREGTPQPTIGVCPECDRPLIPAMYKYWDGGKIQYFLDSEILHSSKFNPSETYGISPIFTLFEKILSIIGMDKVLYKFFYERRMPASMIMVFTDDPESLRRERENIAAKMRLDPAYTPMIAVSSKNNRGRVDMVRLFHTLQEMDYLPVRQEIRERIAAMWGVTPVWQGAVDAIGGLNASSQQLTVMSRVIEGDQRLFHDKVFPRITESFGVTDWELELPQPEEKAEATRISFAQQKISAASTLFNMGFDVKVKSTDVGITDIDFVVSGQAKRPDMGGGMFGGLGADGGGGFGGQLPAGGGQEEAGGGEGQQPPQLQLMQKAQGWIEQILSRGYTINGVLATNPDGPIIKFAAPGGPYLAKFMNGNLVSIDKEQSNLHAHGIYPPHDINQPHENNRAEPRENPYRDVDNEVED